MKLIAKPAGGYDLARTKAGALALEDSLESAVIISLLTDHRADEDDVLPTIPQTTTPIPADRRGWAGDVFGGPRIGSRLWLLRREKQTEETRRRALAYAKEALQWLIDDGHVISIVIDAEWSARNRGRLDMYIRLSLPGGGLFTTTIDTGVVYGL